MKQHDSIEKITEFILPILESLKIELVDIYLMGRMGNQVLRVFVDKDEGITLDHCAKVSREISDIIEIEDLIPGRYRIEVSSPGIDRPLKSYNDFRRNLNRNVKLEYIKEKNERETISGIINEVDSTSVKIMSGQEIINISFENIQSAKILPVW